MEDFDEALFEDNSYDKIFTVNTIYFWKDPKATINKIYSLLKPKGILVIGFYGKGEMEKMSLSHDVFRLYSQEDVAKLLSIDGTLNNVDVISRKGKKSVGYCAVGIK